MKNSDIIVPLVLAGSAIYLLPSLKEGFGKTAVAIGDTAQGVGSGVSTAFQGVGTGVSGIGTGISDLATSTGKAGGGFIESVGGFGSKVFDTGSSFVDIFDAGFDKTSNFIRTAKLPSIPQPNLNYTPVSPNIGVLGSSKALNIALMSNPITAPIAVTSKVIDLVTRNSSRNSSRSSKSKSSSSTKNSRKVVNISRAKDPIKRDYENKNLVSTMKTSSQIKQEKKVKVKKFFKSIGL